MLSLDRDFSSILVSSVVGVVSLLQLLGFKSSNALVIADPIAVLIVLHAFYVDIPLIAHWRLFLIALLLVFAKVARLLGLSVITGQRFGAVGVLITFITLALIYLFPSPFLPAPKGKYSRIGTNSFNITLSDGRLVPVQCWFPIASPAKEHWLNKLTGKNRAVVWTSGCPDYQIEECDQLKKAIQKTFKLPTLVQNHFMLSRSHSEWCDTIELSDDTKYPVAVFSHGLQGWRQVHHTACEKLASNGFVVFAVDHNPDAACSRPFKDLHLAHPFSFKFKDDGTFHPKMRAFYTEGMKRRASDVSGLIDYLETHQELSTKLNLKRVMIWGHSYGGGTVGLVSSQDSRVIGAVMMDSWMFPMPDEVRKKGATVPILAISSELWNRVKFQSPFRQEFLFGGPKPGWNFILKGTNHNNFVDVVHMACKLILEKLQVIGYVDPSATVSALDELLVAYFQCLYRHGSDLTNIINANLKGKPDEIEARHFISALKGVHSLLEELDESSPSFNEVVCSYFSENLMPLSKAPHCVDRYIINLVSHPDYLKRL